MHDAIAAMMDRYQCRTTADDTNALREIIQEVALLGLWRSKFFEKAAFYGGTALRVLYGLDRYSEDMDFSLLASDPTFELGRYGEALTRELSSFGFDVDIQQKRAAPSPLQSAFMKTDTYRALLEVTAVEDVAAAVPAGKMLKIKLEVDTRPPGGFGTEVKFLLQPIPFSVRTYTLPSLFAGKMHAVLCRGWEQRVKGRDWYDLVWYVGRSVPLDLTHLGERMRQSGHLAEGEGLTEGRFRGLLAERIAGLDVEQARRDVEAFVRDRDGLAVWSQDFFLDVVGRIGIE